MIERLLQIFFSGSILCEVLNNQFQTIKKYINSSYSKDTHNQQFLYPNQFCHKPNNTQQLTTIMNLVYVLVPFFKIDSRDHIESHAKQQLGISTRQQENSLIVHEISQNQFALEIKDFNLHFLEINRVLEDYNQAKRKIDILESVIKGYEPQSQMSDQQIGGDMQSLLQKAKKYKQVKEENKKLKKLLQVQLQNTQKVREETQKTMKVLRQQFDALVLEISNKQKSNANSAHQSHSSPPEIQGKQYYSQEKGVASGGGKYANVR